MVRATVYGGLVAVLALTGCAGAPFLLAGVGAADFASTTSTKKTLVDHAVSSATGENCSLVAFSETGTYCQEKITVDRSNLYCYRTLGGVDCHNLPDPYRNGDTALASPPPIRTTGRDKGWLDAIEE